MGRAFAYRANISAHIVIEVFTVSDKGFAPHAPHVEKAVGAVYSP
jgi:hypothetical protein